MPLILKMTSRIPRMLLLVCLFAVALAAGVHFSAPVHGKDSISTSYPDTIFLKTDRGPNQLIISDLNQDHVLDLITANATDGSISIFQGIGRGNFAPAMRIETNGRVPTSLATGHLTSKTSRQLVTANFASSNLSILSQDKNGKYQFTETLKAPPQPAFIATGDLTHGGYDSLVVASRQSNDLAVYINNDGHPPASPVMAATGGKSPVAVIVADVNHDGLPDIVSANNESSDISVIINKGHGQFLPAKTYPTGSGPVGLYASDLNGDGATDIVTANEDDESVSVFMNNGSGVFTAAQKLKVKHPQNILATDVDRDGHPDLIISERDGDQVAVFSGRGDGNFAEAVYIPVKGVHFTSIASADVNGDGTADIVGCDFVSSQVALLLQGIHVPRVESATPTESTKVYAEGAFLDHTIHMQFNTDMDAKTVTGDNIFVYGNMSGYHRSLITYLPESRSVEIKPQGSIREGDTHTRFQPGEVVSVTLTPAVRSQQGIPMSHGYTATFSVRPKDGTGNFAEHQRVSCVKIPGRLRVADMDNDGHVDLVALCREVDSVRLHFNDGKANIDAMVTLPTKGNGPWDLWPADFNRDGLMDIAVVNTFTSELVVFYNQGNRKFGPAVKIASGAGPMGVVAADVNGDGWLDIVTVSKGVPEVSVYLNDGKGGFSKSTTYRVAPSPYHITARDINGDGAVDLLMTNLESDRGTILLNNGNGTYKTPQEFTLLLAKALVDDPIDVNQDGITDMVTVNTASDDLSVFTAEGNGKFKEAVKYSVGASPTDQIFGDFNADGYPDVAVTLDGGKVAILMNKTDGTFAKTMEIGVGKNPTSPVAADFDEDGTLDLVIANQYSHDISILTNRPQDTKMAAMRPAPAK